MRRNLFPLLLSLAAALTATAQSVRWQAPEAGFEIGQINQLALLFDGCEPTESPPPLPAVSNLQFGNPNRGEQTSQRIVNGRVSAERFIYFTYPARPLDDQPVFIPAFDVATDQGTISVPAITVSVRPAVFANTNIPIAQITGSSVSIGDGEVWAGEVVNVDYSIWHLAQLTGQFGEPVWEPAPFVAEPWPQSPTAPNGQVEGDRRTYQFLTRGLLNTPGQYTLPSVQQATLLSVPSRSMFDRPPSEQVVLSSNAPQLTVKPLPLPAPADFGGAVGSFTLTSKVVPEEAKVGDPITWTLALEGTGNWPAISALPARSVSNSFRVVQPEAERANPEDKLFDGSISEDVVLIPTAAGTFTLPGVSWSYFDPTTGRYRTIATDAHELRIEPAATVAPPIVSSGLNSSAASAGDASVTVDSDAPIRANPAPDSPSALPLDPLPGSADAPAPFAAHRILQLGIIAAALLPLWWFALSFRHAKAADPGRHARAAKRHLPVAIQRVATATAANRDAALLEWQRLTAVLWQSAQAVPSRAIFRGDESWAQLWQEAERALYGRGTPLPADWVARAHAAAARKRAPGFPFLRTFAPRHLFPAVALLAGLAATYPNHAYAGPHAAYAAGDFEVAAAEWRAELNAAPTNWVAHHNLALALAQQKQFGEAGAHAAVAFLQNPREPSTRWHLRYTLERSGYTPPIIGRFLQPGWREQVAWWASPAEWQRLLVAAILGLTAGLALLILAAYRQRSPGLRPVAWLLVIVAVGTAASASLSLQTYGITAQTDTVLTWRSTTLRSIPTDLAEEQETTPLAAGSLAQVTKSFLGWRQISFPNGQTGWVRKEELVGLWR